MFGVVGTRTRQAKHLARRFFASLSSERPSASEDRWVRDLLLPGEEKLWSQMSPADQRHAVQVAQDVDRSLPDAPRPVLAAATLHDVGKLVCGFGTFARVVATVFWGVVPARFRAQFAFLWSAGGGLGRFEIFRRLGQYRVHPELGRDLLTEAGSDDFTSAWAAEHHAPIENWSVDPALGHVLKECDDD
ncbi:MAG: hypothetical protein ACN4GZ_07215 [Acidimicrobiales bacterium]